MLNMSRVFCCFVAVLSLAACASDKDENRMCPQVASVRELDRMTDYGREKVIPENLVAMASIARVDGSCEYSEGGVDVLFDIHLAAKKGPRLGGNEVNFPYFVSLVSPKGKVIGKEIMTQSFSFEGDHVEALGTESLRVYIPLEEGEEAGRYQVLLGFQLTPEQLKEVRATEKNEVESKAKELEEVAVKAKEATVETKEKVEEPLTAAEAKGNGPVADPIKEPIIIEGKKAAE